MVTATAAAVVVSRLRLKRRCTLWPVHGYGSHSHQFRMHSTHTQTHPLVPKPDKFSIKLNAHFCVSRFLSCSTPLSALLRAAAAHSLPVHVGVYFFFQCVLLSHFSPGFARMVWTLFVSCDVCSCSVPRAIHFAHKRWFVCAFTFEMYTMPCVNTCGSCNESEQNETGYRSEWKIEKKKTGAHLSPREKGHVFPGISVALWLRRRFICRAAARLREKKRNLENRTSNWLQF